MSCHFCNVEGDFPTYPICVTCLNAVNSDTIDYDKFELVDCKVCGFNKRGSSAQFVCPDCAVNIFTNEDSTDLDDPDYDPAMNSSSDSEDEYESETDPEML